MRSRSICVVSLALWIIGALALGWFFMKGWTTLSADGRTEIILAPAERDQILAEMRQLLQAVHGVITALGSPEQDMKHAEQAARAAGMNMAADTSPAIMVKLPLPFKQMGMSVHRDFDGLADAMVGEATPTQVLNRLSSITSRCTTCHELYRLSAGQ